MDPFIILQVQSSPALSMKPVIILVVSILFIVITIVRFRIHAFLALIMACLLVAVASAGSIPEAATNIQLVSEEFGETAGGIGLVIAFAAIIGMCLMESGAADRIVRWFMGIFGEKNAGWALLTSGFFLSVPVFFDTVFFLLIPLARMLGLRTGKNYMFYVLVMGGAAVITHSLVPPTPGPVIMGEILELDLGLMILVGGVACILPSVAVFHIAKKINGSVSLPVRKTETSSIEELKEMMDKDTRDLPSFGFSILPVILPVILIASFSVIDMIEEPGSNSFLHGIMAVLGEKVIALGTGTLIAIGLLLRQAGLTWKELGKKFSSPLELAGVIILITCAGGAFGAMINNTGIGNVISNTAQQFGINFILLAWLVTAVIRIAQGSGTVAIITGAGLMSAVLGAYEASGGVLDYDKLYIFLAIGFGSLICSWMNDSAFWIVGKLSGMTERETLSSWTVLTTTISLFGLILVLLFSVILPLA